MRKRAILTAVVLALVPAVPAAHAGPQPPPDVTPTPTAAPTPTVAPTPGYVHRYDFAHPQVLATGLEVPWGLAFLPDHSALVAQRDSGTVLRIRPGQPPVQVATVPGVVAGGEAGLLGLAVSPGYRRDGLVYACFTTATDIRVVRFRLDAPQRQQVLLSGLARNTFHDGGRIAFGPDGLLYVGVGDAGVPARAQDLASRNGKILRIRPDGSVPAGNPFPGSPVYSYGHRNVQGLAWDGHGRLFATEFGQNTWDELNRIVPGGNYGWPVVEGRAGDPRFRDPLVVWPPAEASPSGLAYAHGTLFVAALRGQRLWAVPVDRDGQVGTPVAELVGAYGRLRTVARAFDGSLWVTTSNRDGRATPAPDDDRILRFTRAPRHAQPRSTRS
ncbi:PQQ-dependent sugar dehydrogenase [Micromonospora sp. NPDC000089]|uniref:PQQ-dependent sugar dehydrogenase n=1 Tax=unclassified Micromonospora TaxID=2617518 RepID=UPI0036AFA7A9